MHPQHPSDREPGNAASSAHGRRLAPAFVLLACLGIATTVAVPDDAPAPAADAKAKDLDDAYVARFERAQRLLGKGKDAEAEQILRELVAERSDQPSVHHALAVLLQFRHRPDEATAEFLLAAKQAPDEPVIQKDTGAHLLALGRPADAEPYFAAAVRLWPSDVECAVGLAGTLRALGRRAEAEAAYRRAVQADANSVDAAVGLAACVVETKPAEALKLVEKATGQWPDVLLVRGMALARLEQYDAATDQISKVVELAPPAPAGLAFVRGAAEAAVLAGDAKLAAVAASRWFETESAAGAASEDACACLALVRLAVGDAKGALTALDAAPPIEEATAERRAHVKLLRAVALLRAERGDDAKAQFDSLAGFAPERFERSAALRLTGRMSAAEFAKLTLPPDRENDRAWIDSLAAEMAGDAEAASKARARAAELSHPRGEFPGLLVR